jgi:hypothetical protein
MRKLTPEETLTLEDRWKNYGAFLKDIRPAVEEFIRLVGHNPDPYIQDFEKFLPALEDWLRDQDVNHLSEDDWLWLQVQIGYFIGELLSQRFDAMWIICEDPESKFFLRYVLGYFKHGVKKGLILDPIEVAGVYLESPPPRSLLAVLDSIDELQPDVRRGRKAMLHGSRIAASKSLASPARGRWFPKRV